MASQTGITVTGHHNPLAFFLYMTHLTIEVDGQAVAGGWKDRFVPTAPGDHQLNVYFWYLGRKRCCEASATVQVPEGAAAAMRYKAPQLMFSPGRLEQL
jgi:hypothetical protein